MTWSVDDKSNYAEAILERERRISLPAKWLLLALGLISTHFVATYRVFPWLTMGSGSR